MAQVLEVAELVDQYGVTEVKVRRRRIKARLDPQRPAALQARYQFGIDKEFITPPPDDLHTPFDVDHQYTPDPCCCHPGRLPAPTMTKPPIQ